nr:sulfite exporter TauE/SafE family protein [Clostridium grantii]
MEFSEYTGSFIGGATSMFAFSLGTVPLMLSFGALTGFLSKDYTKKILKLSGFMILFLEVIMTNRGLALSGLNIKTLIPDTNYNSTDTDNTEENTTNFAKATIKDGYQEVKISALARGYTPSVLYVQKISL